MNIAKLATSDVNFSETLNRLLDRGSEAGSEVFSVVMAILEAVRQEGDAAVLRYTEMHDRLSVSNPQQLWVPPARRARALNQTAYGVRNALEQAADRIRVYHERQIQADWSFQDAFGNTLMQRFTPLERVGLYVPGGLASYPSSVLMNAIPAKVAGVSELVMVVPAPDGKLNDLVLAAAEIAGVDQIYTVGGAQAVGALAYGTETIPRVDKIVGPGNQYVMTAKRFVFGTVGIDMVAGPSEVLIIADESANPEWVAWDLIAQAEHDEMAQSILVTDSESLRQAVYEAIQRLVPTQPRRDIIQKSLSRFGALILVRDRDDAIACANRIASEHLELMVLYPEKWLTDIRHAGSILLGSRAAVAMGDYSLGSNHVLPTVGGARFSSPLGVDDFRKRTSVVMCSEAGSKYCAEIARTLAREESLEAHARAAECRLGSD